MSMSLAGNRLINRGTIGVGGGGGGGAGGGGGGQGIINNLLYRSSVLHAIIYVPPVHIILTFGGI